MSAAEMTWRMHARLRDALDRVVAPIRARELRGRRVCRKRGAGSDWRGAVVGEHLPEAGELPPLAEAAGWRDWLIEEAEGLCEHRVTLFDLEQHPLGAPIRWNHEYKADRPTPMLLAPKIDYRDYAVTGDCKFAWEPSRHQHWVVLGRAYRLTGQERYAAEILDQLGSWMDQCPFGYGMQWRSPLELGIRLINWVWALELIRPSGLVTPEVIDRVHGFAWRHLWEVSRKYARYSSANNHLVGEAAGVFVGSSYFAGLRHAARWREESRRILLEEIFRQTSEDGGTREQATGYHCFSLEFFLIAGLAARRIGLDFPAEYWRRLEAMFSYLAVLTEGGSLPMFGDADDGYVLDLGGRQERVESLLAIGAVLFERPDWKAQAGQATQPLYWLLGNPGCEALAAMPEPAEPMRLESKALAGSGYYLLQSGQRGADDAVSVVMDCGELGMGAIAAHGHADALSFVLRAAGWDILVDPGTYDYFTYPAWRDYFRSTRAHNTIMVDGRDQSEPLGRFLWGRRARSRLLAWEPGPQGGLIRGEHDGYRRLRRGVVHRRTLELDAVRGELTITDELEGKGNHSCELHLHAGEGCEVEWVGEGRFAISSGRASFEVQLDACWESCLVKGHENPIAGWVSRGYHRKTPSYTIAALCQWRGSLRSCSRIRWGMEPCGFFAAVESRGAAVLGV